MKCTRCDGEVNLTNPVDVCTSCALGGAVQLHAPAYACGKCGLLHWLDDGTTVTNDKGESAYLEDGKVVARKTPFDQTSCLERILRGDRLTVVTRNGEREFFIYRQTEKASFAGMFGSLKVNTSGLVCQLDHLILLAMEHCQILFQETGSFRSLLMVNGRLLTARIGMRRIGGMPNVAVFNYCNSHSFDARRRLLIVVPKLVPKPKCAQCDDRGWYLANDGSDQGSPTTCDCRKTTEVFSAPSSPNPQ